MFVKNPNYNPNDPNSKRYVDTGTAQTEAQKRATQTNTLFGLAGNMREPVSASAFFAMPTNMQTTTPAVSGKVQTNLQDIVNKFAQPNAPQSRLPQPTQNQPSAQLRDLSIQLANGEGQVPTQLGATPGGGFSYGGGVGADAPTDNLATLAARAGLSVSEYQTLLQNQSTASGAEVDEIRNELGIPGLIENAFKKPDRTSIDMYKELYSELGLNDLKEKIAGVDERLQSRRNDLVEAAGAVKNNPWLSQGSRTGRLRILNELATADISNILDERQQLLDIYDEGVSEIERQVGFMLSDQAENRQLTVDELNFLLGEAERRTNALERDTLTEGLRNVPDFLRASRAEILRGEAGSGVGGGYTITGNGDPSTLSVRAKAVYDNPGVLDNYTPTERGKILDELAAKGFDLGTFTQQSLNAGQREQIAGFDDLIRQGQELEIILSETGLDVGPIASRFAAAGAATGIGDTKDFTDYRSIIDNMGSALLKLRSGAAVTPQEFERLRGFIPGKNDPEETALNKIQNFYSELEKVRQNYVNRATQSTSQIQQSVGVGNGAATTATSGGIQPTAADSAYVSSLGF